MSERPSRSYLSTGWLLVFIWPPVVIFITALLVPRLFSGDGSIWLLIAAFASLGLVCVLVEWSIRACKWLVQLRRHNPYGCPVCGYDIRATPHRCPECGSRLLWGQLPGPSDRVRTMNDRPRRAY